MSLNSLIIDFISILLILPIPNANIITVRANKVFTIGMRVTASLAAVGSFNLRDI